MHSVVPIDSPAVLREALAQLRDPIALDTEFHAEHHYFAQLMLVQIRDGEGCEVLVDAKAIRDLRPLGEALSGRPLILHAAAMDLELLARKAGLRPGPVTDTQVLAGFSGMGYPRALSDLQDRVLGVKSTASMGLSDWSQRPLSEEQIHYAMEDVRHLHALAAALEPRAHDGCAGATAELVERAMALPSPERAWRHIPAVEVLDGPGREVLRRLAAWREIQAREGDRPPYQIASNAVLIDVARRRPRSVAELQTNRKMPRGVVRKHSERLIQAVIEAESMPPSSLPESAATTAESRALECLIEAWAAVVELRDGVASRLLMPRALRRAVAAAAALDQPLAPLLGWRERWAGELDDLLAGRAVLGAGPDGPALKKPD